MADVRRSKDNSWFQRDNHIALPRRELNWRYVLSDGVARAVSQGKTIAIIGEAAFDFGNFVLTGQDAELSSTAASAYTISADNGAFALTGQAANFTYDAAAIEYSITAASGSFALSGQTANLNRGPLLIAANGGFALGGQAVTWSRTYSFSVEHGDFTLTGGNADFLATVHIVFSNQIAAEFSLTGQEAALLGFVLFIPSGSDSLLTSEGDTFKVQAA